MAGEFSLAEILEMGFADGRFPTPNDASSLFLQHINRGADDIIADIRNHPSFSDSLQYVRSSADGMTRDDIKNTFISFLDKHYPVIMNEIWQDETRLDVAAAILGKLLDEVVPVEAS
jgi:hypothetical protein